MAELLERIGASGMDRREFVALAASVGIVANLGLTGCDNTLTETTEESPTIETLSNGKWVTVACPQDGCNRGCLNQAYVVDGVVVRQRTDELVPDTPDNPQYRSCIKGRSIRRTVTAADRLKYPMKRKGWQPGGGSNVNGHLRGVDEWERITWDEATGYIADEYRRIMDTYGPRAFLATGQDERKMCGGKIGSGILNMLGGCLTTFGEQSDGGAPVPSYLMWGFYDSGLTNGMDKMAQRHTKLQVLWGFNSAWCDGAANQYDLLTAKKQADTKVVLIDVWFNPTAQSYVDQWIPIRPSTDGALMEAVAHELIVNGLVDQDFLDRCTVGFDAGHMPADAKVNENFRDYILGAYDGLPKTPEWASPLTGVPVETIRQLAQDMGTIKPMSLKGSRGLTRCWYGNRLAQLFYTLGWMTGNLGVVGTDNALLTGTWGVKNGEELVHRGKNSWKYPKNPICSEPRASDETTFGGFDPNKEYGIAFSEWHKAIVEGEYTLPNPRNEKRACDIKCIMCENARNGSNAQTGNYLSVEAYRKVEFVVHQEMFMKVGPMYSDIVLPVTCHPELEFALRNKQPDDALIMGTNAFPQFYECKDDIEIYFTLCDALGFGEDIAPRTSVKQNMFEQLGNAQVIKEDGEEYETLFTITQEDIDKYEVNFEPQEGRTSFADFMETGIYRVERRPDDNFLAVPLEDFVKDPEANPLETPSGKLEIYCQSLADWYDLCQLHDIDPIPKYRPAPHGYEDIQNHPDYRFQMVTPHHLRQLHSVWANDRSLNEVFPNDLLISTYDAEREGFTHGDWALVSGLDAGQIVRRIAVLPTIAPGVAILGEGNWRVIDHETGIDIGGNANTLTRPHLLGNGYQAYNTVLLKLEPYTGPAMLPDYQRPIYVPIAD
ncbi:MAG: molybdopterin-dependent oxidoreductase [Coriobacteriales bacterium]|nr:molybdopterin-dependent oxidoreductase [Coriobacteriales bacterium]